MWWKLLSASWNKKGICSGLMLSYLNLTQGQPVTVVRFKTVSGARRMISHLALAADNTALGAGMILRTGWMEDAATRCGGGASTTSKQFAFRAIRLFER